MCAEATVANSDAVLGGEECGDLARFESVNGEGDDSDGVGSVVPQSHE